VHVGSDVALATAFARDVLAEPGSTAIVEAYLDGPEVSLFALSDGRTVVPLLPAQDFKRVGDGDEGPNTGGMGAYAPLAWLPPGSSSRCSARCCSRSSTSWPGADAVQRPALRRARDDVERSAGHRVQLPVR
jgi:phosphoribosylamine--glycine ligase